MPETSSVRSGGHRLTRRGLLAAASGLGLATLVGCSSSNDNLAAQANSADGKGFISGDGTVTEYAQGKRSDPIQFSGKLFDGTTVTQAYAQGKPAVMNFWYAGCAPCRAEAPHLQKLHEHFGSRVTFLGVNLRDEKGTAEAFDRTFNITYPSVEDRTGEVLMAVSEFVPAQAVPTTLVLDTEGRVAARVLGQIDESTLRTLVQDALGGNSASASSASASSAASASSGQGG